MSTDLDGRRDLVKQLADTVTTHVAWCDECDLSAKDPNWIIGLCWLGEQVVQRWRKSEADYFEGVLSLDVDGNAGG